MEILVFLGIFYLIAALAFWAGLSSKNFLIVLVLGIIAPFVFNDIKILAYFLLYLSIWSRIFSIV